MIHEDFFVYNHGASILYKISPLIKFLFMILFSSVVMTGNDVTLWISLIVLVAIVLVSSIKIRYILEGSLFVLLFVAIFKIIAIISISFTPFVITVPSNALQESSLYIIRIMMVFFCNALFYTTTALSDLRRVLRKYEKFIFFNTPPIYLPSTILMLFLKFIPLSIASWHELETAWLIRGGTKGLKKIYMLLPKLIERMLKKALETAYALTMRALN